MDIYQILRVPTNTTKQEIQEKYIRLLETYQLTAAFAENEEVAKIAELKLNQMIDAGKKHGLHTSRTDANLVSTTQVDASLIKLALNSSNSSAAKLKGSNILGKINALPECADKYYLNAIVNLRLDSSLQGCQNAINSLRSAIAFDPSNEAYTGLLDALGEQITAYETRLREQAARDEAERLLMERESQAELSAARRRQFFGSLGPAIGGILYLGAIALTCWCVWDCCNCSSCCSC